MQKKTDPSQILFAALAPSTSELILHPHPTHLIPSFLQCQHLQAERDPDQSPQGTKLPMDSASPPCPDHPKLGALPEAQAYQPAFPESPQSGSSWQVQFTGNVDRWLAGWDGNLCFFLISPICQSGPKWGKVGKEKGRKGWGYLTSRKIRI